MKVFCEIQTIFAVFAISVSSILSLPAHAKQIFSKLNQDQVIRILKNPNDTVTFELCSKLDLENCRSLGSRQEYTAVELQKVRSALRLKGYGVAALDAVLVIGMAATGYLVGGMIGSHIGSAGAKSSGTTLFGFISAGIFQGSRALIGGGFGAGVFGTATVFTVAKYLNPFEYFRMHKTLDEALAGEDEIIDQDIYSIANELDHVLKSI